VAAVAALVLLSAAVRAARLDGMSIWQDEGLSLYRASLSLRGILGGEIPLGDLITPDVHPPLYFLLLAGWQALAGAEIWTAKWLSLAAGLPTTPLAWALGRRTVGGWAGVVAALLAALSPLYLWYAQEVRSYGLIVTLGLAAVYAVTRAAWGPGARRWSLIAVGATGALLWTHYLAFTLLPVLAVAPVVALAARGAPRRARHLPAVLAALAGACALALPLLPFAIHRLGLGAETNQRFVPLQVMLLDVVRGFGFGRTLYGAEALDGPAGALVAGLMVLLAALVALGLAAAWRARPRAAVLLASYLFLPVGGLYLLTLVKPVYLGAYHLILASPPFYLLLGAGLLAAARAHRLAGAAAGVVVLAVFGLADLNFYREPSFRKDDLRALARYVDARALPGDLLAVSDPVLERSLEHLARRVPVEAVPRMLRTSAVDDRPPAEQLAPLLERHARLWFMTPRDDHRAWLDRNALLVDEKWFHGATMPVRVTAHESPPGATDLAAARHLAPAADLGGLRLLAWRVQPEPLVSGAPGRVGLWWSAGRDGLPDYKVALRLLDTDGYDWADGDHEPFHGLRPVSGWGAGRVVYEPHDLLLHPGAPAGELRLAVTVYDPASGAVHPAAVPLELGAVTVARPAAPPRPGAVPVGVRARGTAADVEVLGLDVPRGVRGPGEVLPVAVWLRARADAPASHTLALELLDGSGRVALERRLTAGPPPGPATGAGPGPSPAGPSPAGAWLAGDVRRVAGELTLPAEGGRYRLRLRLLGDDGRARWLRRVALPARGLWLTDLVVAEPRRERQLPPGAIRLDVPVGEAAVLVGWSAPGPAPAAAAGAGAEMLVHLYWSALRPPEVAYHVTLQAVPVSESGEVSGAPVAQDDGPPAGGARPATGWAVGEVIADERRLRLPMDLPPGRYLLIAALYDPRRPLDARPLVTQDGRVRDFVVLDEYAFAGGPPAEAAP